jgi:predicted amidophosphoribosyltransferase
MLVHVRKLEGPWDLGFALDKHTLGSVYIGDNQYGHPQFDTKRSEVGEALYQLKYRHDESKAPVIAAQLAESLSASFGHGIVVVPMPPSRQRSIQPVPLIARGYAQIVGARYEDNLLIKFAGTSQMKDIPTREEKIAALQAVFACNDVLSVGSHDVLIVDDLHDSGASLEAATRVLRTYSKVRRVLVATATSKR